MAIFGDFFASCISREPHAARFRPASEIRTKATPCVEVWQTSNLRQLRLDKEKRRKKKPQGKNITVCPIFHRATIINSSFPVVNFLKCVVTEVVLFSIVAYKTPDISQGSVATYLRSGGIFSDSIITNFLVILVVKQFWKSVNIW